MVRAVFGIVPRDPMRGHGLEQGTQDRIDILRTLEELRDLRLQDDDPATLLQTGGEAIRLGLAVVQIVLLRPETSSLRAFLARRASEGFNAEDPNPRLRVGLNLCGSFGPS